MFSNSGAGSLGRAGAAAVPGAGPGHGSRDPAHPGAEY